jgi:hypothetical protein
LEEVIKGSSLNRTSSAKKYNSQKTTLQLLNDISNHK